MNRDPLLYSVASGPAEFSVTLHHGMHDNDGC